MLYGILGGLTVFFAREILASIRFRLGRRRYLRRLRREVESNLRIIAGAQLRETDFTVWDAYGGDSCAFLDPIEAHCLAKGYEGVFNAWDDIVSYARYSGETSVDPPSVVFDADLWEALRSLYRVWPDLPPIERQERADLPQHPKEGRPATL